MNGAQPSKRRLIALLPLAVVAMVVTACGAHPPNVPYEVVERVVVVDAVPYVVASQQCLEGYTPWEPCPPEEQVVYTSTDRGLTWHPTTTAPAEVAAGRADWTPHRRVACLAETPAVCYRIDGGETIERSADGGETWLAVWEMPSGRRAYQAREMTRLTPDTQPYDIALLDTGDEMTVIAAMGNQGVLTGTADGSWRRAPVGLAVPVRYQATTLAMALSSLTLELGAAILAAALLLLALCLVGWGVIFARQADSEEPPRSKRGCVPPVLLLGLGLLAPWPIALVFRLSTEMTVSLFVVLPLLGAGLAWAWVSRTVPRRGAAWRAALACVYHPILLFVALMLPLVLWALGAASFYILAFGAAALLGLAAVIWAVTNEIRLARRARRPPAVPAP